MGDPQAQYPPDGPRRPGPGLMPVLTEQERQIMKECEKESFYKRALPISFGCMLAAQGLVRSGRWSAHPRFGALPKMILTGGFGYFLGKISYFPVCQQKILDTIPDSNLATAIRKSKGIPQPEGLMPAMDERGDDVSTSKGKFQDDYSASAFKGLDDRNRPSMDREVKPEAEEKEENKAITYDELRRRNRQEYEDNMSKRPQRPSGTPSYKDSQFMPQPPWPEKTKPAPNTDESAPPQPPTRRKRTNMWGDPIDE